MRLYVFHAMQFHFVDAAFEYLIDLFLVRIYASMNRVNIGSDNGLSPIRRTAII